MEWKKMVAEFKRRVDDTDDLDNLAEDILCDPRFKGETLWMPKVLSEYVRDLINDAANSPS